MAFLSVLEFARGRVDQMRPEVVSLMMRVMNDFEKETGLKTTLPDYGGWRSFDVQAQLLTWKRQAGATYAVGGVESSRHVYGGAFDLHIMVPAATGGWRAIKDLDEARSSPHYPKLGAIGERYGLTWGGRFGNTDPFHFELRETLDEAKRRWEAHVRGRLWRVAIGVGFAALAFRFLR